MRVLSVILIIASLAGVVSAQDEDTHPVLKRLLNSTEPEKPELLAKGLEDWHRQAIAFSLLRERKRVRDSVLTLASIKGKSGFTTETEEVFESLGPNTRAAVVPVLIEWLRGENASLRRQANRTLHHIDGVPASVVPALIEMTKDNSESSRQLSLIHI